MEKKKMFDSQDTYTKFRELQSQWMKHTGRQTEFMDYLNENFTILRKGFTIKKID